jgi:PKD repeat protein
MKKLILLMFMCGLIIQASAHDKKTLIERFTNSGCVPCRDLNVLWYNATTHDLVNSSTIAHIVYNVDWPYASDPMHILNKADNNTRRGYYGVNAVPWIDINGANFNTGSGSAAFLNAVNSGNAEYAPFSIVLTPVKFSNNVINVHVAINRDANDVTVFGDNVSLQVGITEKTVAYSSPQPNGELEFFSICRKMLPDAKGTLFTIPAPGETTELDLDYIPTQAFLNAVDFDSLRIVAYIQDNDTKEVFQSEMSDVVLSGDLNASFKTEETLGGLPFAVNFEDYSSATDTTSIISWAWDFDNDGNIDSQDQNPSWTYTTEGAYTVSLTVSDGINQYTRTLENYVHAIGKSSDILVVNGIEYVTYPAEMESFYAASACFGDHQVDVWDLFGDQGFDYTSNPNILKVDKFNHTIPNSLLQQYAKVIWIGNDYGGDVAFYDANQVLDYVQMGGNFILAARYGSHFFNTELKNYCGITSFTGDSQINSLLSMDPNLVDVAAVGTNSLVHFATLDAASEAVPIFDDNASTPYIAGFKLSKDSSGVFIYIAGRPYRFDNAASYANYNYILDNWMTGTILTGTNPEVNNLNTAESFQLDQNYPNPFNPATRISYSISKPGQVSLKVYDILGREVAALVNGYQQANHYSVNFNAGKLASGIYLYKLKTGEFVQTRKMLLLK